MRIEEITKSNVKMDDSKRIVLNILYTNNIIGDKFLDILKPFDLSGEQYNVLRIVRGQKGNPANMCLIQERMITKNSNTTRLIDKLLLKELVTRNVCPENRRKIEIAITKKGLDVLQELDPKVKEHEENFATNLSAKEVQQLITLLEKYRQVK
ncbi:MarR family winged helix-turn-helix transcriptional regulator [Flavobacterium sp.]|jgi:DNA-binding MarR family transcriptional regulator|uniref:MarR family winged helix-turn-helix transcriptional regulator n=1 Tax=Flavobacterium sp. TaxID=239 RepID=UPI0037C1370B